MYFFALRWRILSKFACFAMERSHQRLKRMLHNSGGLSLGRGKLGLAGRWLWITPPLMTVSAARDGIPSSGACAAKGPDVCHSLPLEDAERRLVT